jgi:hypothetical protein
MKAAGQEFVGQHDFRNFCKIDPTRTVNFERVIISFSIDPVDDGREYNFDCEFQLTIHLLSKSLSHEFNVAFGLLLFLIDCLILSSCTHLQSADVHFCGIKFDVWLLFSFSLEGDSKNPLYDI